MGKPLTGTADVFRGIINTVFGAGKDSTMRRWVFNNFLVILVILLGILTASAILIRSYYYNSARQYLNSRMNTVYSILSRAYSDVARNFSYEVQNAIINWSEADRIELMAADRDGKILLASGGFSPEYDLRTKDFTDAAESGNYGYYTGKLASGETVIAVTAMLPSNSGGYTALRMMSSLEKIDRQINTLILGMVLAAFFVMFLIAVSGLYFVRSIVVPVKQLGIMAGRYAKGDFSVRITKKNDDEIGDLCDTINKMAETLSESENIKNEFISSVSHELRTPLTAIKGWSETISVYPEDEETVKKGMRVIGAETERLSEMVEELLDFSRMQNGKFTLTPAKMDILAEIGDAVLIYSQRAAQEGKVLDYEEPDFLPFIVGDRNRLRQVFINIIDNAVKYTDRGGTISVVAGVADAATITVSVSDTGVGISAEDLPKIKTKFFKANHTRRGSGIGLAVADEIVKMHGGTLSLESEIGKGTTVTVRLPVSYL
ncbi:MAG: HAMP domain-containing histidine kinase [Ruminococcus sp.]|jgi:signal transduction histidine kinase|nr:HAMP domain-containing histidine kinase [Ruminococcus sp.]